MPNAKGKKGKGKSVAKTGGKVPAKVTELFETDAGAGMEDIGADDMAIPFLQILQSGSPQLKRSEGEFIKVASEGNIFNSVTKDLFDGDIGILVIPCHYQRTFIKWGDREAGGGLLAIFPVDEGLSEIRNTQRDEKGRDAYGDGSYLVDTRSHFLLLLNEDTKEVQPVVISMASTQNKKSRQWITRMNNLRVKGEKGMFTPPMFSQIYRLKTIPESNAKGSWYGWLIEHEESIKTVQAYSAAKTFHESCVKGMVRSAPPVEADAGDEDVPF